MARYTWDMLRAPAFRKGKPSPPKRNPRVQNRYERGAGIREWKITVAGNGAIVPIIYGKTQIGGQIYAVAEDPHNNQAVLIGVVWCVGEIESIDAVYIDSEKVDPQYREDFLGRYNQPVSSWLQNAIAGYADDLTTTINGERVGIAHSVIRVSKTQQINRIMATVRGRKLYDPRKAITDDLSKREFVKLNGLSKPLRSLVLDKINWTKGFGVGGNSANEVYTFALDVSGRLETLHSLRLGYTSSYAIQAIFFSPDGIRYYTLETSGSDSTLREYGLSSPFDLSNKTLQNSVPFAGYGARTFCLSDDGSKLYIEDRSNNKIEQHSLPTAWSLSGITLDGSVNTISGQPVSAICFSNDGLHVLEGDDAAIGHRQLNNAWDLLSTSSTEFIPESEAGTWNVGGLQFLENDRAYIVTDIENNAILECRRLPEYSDNPSLALADIIASRAIGAGMLVDYEGLADCANANDDTTGLRANEKRRTIGLALTYSDFVQSHVETLQTYASVYLDMRGPTVYLRPDRPLDFTNAIHFDENAGDMLAGSVVVQKADVLNLPTVVTCSYTKTKDADGNELTEYTEGFIDPIIDDRVLSGLIPWKEAKLSLPGIQSKAQATREALEYYKHLRYEDFSATFTVFDEGLAVSVGDPVLVSLRVGVTEKQCRITDIQTVGLNKYQITVKEYQADVYSDETPNEDELNDTSLVPPSAVPAVANLVLTEEPYRADDGSFATHILISWDGITGYPYSHYYQVKVERVSDNQQIMVLNVNDTSTATPTLPKTGRHRVTVKAIGFGGNEGLETVKEIDVLGKQIPPADVTVFSGYEIGGTVYLSWDRPRMSNGQYDPDIDRYEIRFSPLSGDWDSAQLLDQVDTLRLQTNEIGEGDFRFYIKAIDSLEQYSQNPATTEITVTLDNNAYLVDKYSFEFGNNAGLNVYSIQWPFAHKEQTATGSFQQRYLLIPYFSSTVGDVFTNADIDTSYPDAALTYIHSSETGKTWEQQPDTEYSYPSSLGGTWSVRKSNPASQPVIVKGAIAEKLALRESGSVWNEYDSLSVKTTADAAKWIIRGDANNLAYAITPDVYLQINVVPRSENGNGTTDSTGKIHVDLQQRYSNLVSINATVTDGQFAVLVADNIVVGQNVTNSFDIYALDQNGNPITSGVNVSWQWNGVG